MTEQETSEQAPQKDVEPDSKIHEADSGEVVETNVSLKPADIRARSLKKGAAEKLKLQTLAGDDASLQDKDPQVDSKAKVKVKVSEKQHIIPDRNFPDFEEADLQKTLVSTKMRRQRFAKTKEASDRKIPSESVTVEDKTEAGMLRKYVKPETSQGFMDEKSPHTAEKRREAQTVIERDQVTISTIKDKTHKVYPLKEIKTVQEEEKVKEEGLEEIPEITEAKLPAADEQTSQTDGEPKESTQSNVRRQKLMKTKDTVNNQLPLKPVLAKKGQPIKDKMTDKSEQKEAVSKQPTEFFTDGQDETFRETDKTKDADSTKVLITSEKKKQKFPQSVDTSDKEISLVMKDKSKKVTKDELPDKDKEQVDQPTDDEMLPKERTIKPQQDQIKTSTAKERTLKVSPLKAKEKPEETEKQNTTKTEDKQIPSKTTFHLEKANLTSVNDRADIDKALPRLTKQDRSAENLSEIQEAGFATGEADGSPKELAMEREELDDTGEAADQKIQPKLVRDKDKTQTDRRAKSAEQQFKIKVLDEGDLPANIEETSVRKEIQLDQEVTEGSTSKEKNLLTEKLQKTEDLTDEFQSSLQAPDREGRAYLTEEKETKQKPEMVLHVGPSKKHKPVPSQLEKHTRFTAKEVHATEVIVDEFGGFKPTHEELEKVQRKTPEVPVGQEEAETQKRPEDAERDAQIPDDRVKDLKIVYKPEKNEVLGKISTETQPQDARNAEEVTEMDKTTTTHPAEEIKTTNTETKAAGKGEKTKESNQISHNKEATEEQKLDQTSEITQDVAPGKKSKSLKEKGTKIQVKESRTAISKQEYGSFTSDEEAETPQMIMKLSVAPVMEVASETSHIAVDDNEVSSLKMVEVKVEDGADKLPKRPEQGELKSQVRSEPQAEEVLLEKVKLLNKPASFPPKHTLKQTEAKDGELSPQEVQSRTVRVKQEHGEISQFFPETKQQQKTASAAPVMEIAAEKYLITEVSDFKSDRFLRSTPPDDLETNVEMATEKTFDSVSPEAAEIEEKDLRRQGAPTTDKVIEDKTQQRVKRREKSPIESFTSKADMVRDHLRDVSQTAKMKQQETEQIASKSPAMGMAYEKPMITHRQEMLDTTQRYMSPDSQVKDVRSGVNKVHTSGNVSVLIETSTKDQIQALNQPEEIAVNVREPKLEMSRTFFVAAETQDASDKPVSPGDLPYTGAESDATVQAKTVPVKGQPSFEPSVTDKPTVRTTGYPSEHTRTTPHIHSMPAKTHETRTEAELQGMQSITEMRGLTVEPEGKENLFLQEASRGTEGGNCH
ncbi:uncharacterized protein FYW61_008854 [Anableps anableps]